MIKGVPFQTRARTIDHLGREQIADCPTAITELWKNAYDAYAREVSLHLFDGAIPVAGVYDDGHGINLDEFLEKWLVIGTDSKTSKTALNESDRCGLSIRPKLGQKGIGRLSCGAMGSLLLLVSKRKDSDYIASFIDWRIFENPFLMLGDISLPISEFSNKEDILQSLPAMRDHLLDNVWPKDADSDRGQRITKAWEMFSALENENGEEKTTADQIAELIIENTFTERHLENWPVWKGQADKGTALAIANLKSSLIVNLKNRSEATDIEEEAKGEFFETLSAFYDPYTADTSAEIDYRFEVWTGEESRVPISNTRQFDRDSLLNLEHTIDGEFDINGIFKGNIKAFGEDLGYVEIAPPTNYNPGSRASRVGSFKLTLGAFEGNQLDSTLTPEEHAASWEEAGKYGGLFLFRDNLRLLPYGRIDNDFFRIEEKRSKNAGNAFFSSRRLFGRISITREDNPSLRDKAGREGLIDNAARRAFRSVVVHFLKHLAHHYYGRSSNLRKERLPVIQEANELEAATAAKNSISKIRSNFRNALRENRNDLDQQLIVTEELKTQSEMALKSKNADELLVILDKIDTCRAEKGSLRLPPKPKKLNKLEEPYIDYSKDYSQWIQSIDELAAVIGENLEVLNPKQPEEIAHSSLRRQAKTIHDQIRKWKTEISKILNNEVQRFEEQVAADNKRYDLLATPTLTNLGNKTQGLAATLNQFDEIRDELLLNLSEKYEPYLRAITSLSQGLDLDSASYWNSTEADRLNQELEKFSALAQMGITVELISHELERFDHTIGEHLENLPSDIKEKPDFKIAKQAHHELTERLRFLSPLQLSGASKTRTSITGKMIGDYVYRFFKSSFKESDLEFKCTPAFEEININEFESRIYPVFINLVNNARYWACQAEAPHQILIDYKDGKVIISDTGPGVSELDQEQLFTLYFSKKMRGRGVGLYLCRTNLAHGRHHIYYATDSADKVLTGANFVIEFKGVKNG
jgi:hypothetical protein